MRMTPYSGSSRSFAIALHILLAWGLALVGVLGSVVFASPIASAASLAVTQTSAGRAPGGDLSNPVVRQVDVASPAVVRLATVYNAHITLSLCGKDVTLPPAGAGYTVGGLGSGAFISANGDILTAGHVVNIDHADLDPVMFQSPDSAQQIASAIDSATCLGVAVNATDVENGAVQSLGIPYSIRYSPPRRYAWRDTNYTGPITPSPQDSTDELTGLLKAQTYAVSVVAYSSFAQDDVAIAHIPLTDTPSITLDDATNVEVLDPLTVIGFPGNGDANFDPTNLLTPSINTATVSAIKRNDDGAELIQVGGNIEHGDSGGPVLDTSGHIVGIVSFGGADTQGITAFLRSSNSAMLLINANGISVKPGAFERRWEQAFGAYTSTRAGHWHTAAQELDALARDYPDFLGILPYRVYADVAAAHEAAPAAASPVPAIGLLLGSIVLIIVIVVISAVVALAFLLPARRQHTPSLVAPTPPQPGNPRGYTPVAGAPATPSILANSAPTAPAYPGYPMLPAPPVVPAQQSAAMQPVSGQIWQPQPAPNEHGMAPNEAAAHNGSDTLDERQTGD